MMGRVIMTPDESVAVSAVRRAGAKFAFVHGSRAAEGVARPDSDLDVAAWWGSSAPQAFDVDLPPTVDLVVLDHAPLWLAGRIALTGRLLFDDDPSARVAWQADTRRVWLDEWPYLLARQREWRKAVPRVVDEERVTRVAGEVLTDVARLRQLADTPDLVHQPDQLDAVKYRFITAIERCVGIAHHIIASEGWAAPETNADAVRELGHHGVVGPESATSLARASGFRNLLVHQYGDIDDKRVVEFLDRLSDLEQFVRQVLTWIDSQA